jgi:hypothetical protein
MKTHAAFGHYAKAYFSVQSHRRKRSRSSAARRPRMRRPCRLALSRCCENAADAFSAFLGRNAYRDPYILGNRSNVPFSAFQNSLSAFRYTGSTGIRRVSFMGLGPIGNEYAEHSYLWYALELASITNFSADSALPIKRTIVFILLCHAKLWALRRINNGTTPIAINTVDPGSGISVNSNCTIRLLVGVKIVCKR